MHPHDQIRTYRAGGDAGTRRVRRMPARFREDAHFARR